MTEQDRAKALQRVLEGQAMRLVPEHADVWPQVAAAIQPRRRARALPNTRVGWVMASLMLLVVLGAGGYAVGSQIVGQESFTILTGQNPDVVRHLGYTQTIDGVSFTLERVYVDGDRIGVDALVTGMPEPYRDERGLDHRFYATANLAALDGTILRSGPSIMTRADRDTSGQYVASYEMSRTQGASSDLPLRSEVSVLEFIIDQNDPNWVVEPTTFAGPVVFEFTVPLEDGP